MHFWIAAMVVAGLGLALVWNRLNARRRLVEDLNRRGKSYLSLMLQEKPTDPIWRLVTRENVDKFQRAFVELEQRLELTKLYSSNRIDDELADRMVAVVNELERRYHPLHPAILLLLVHQYIDADQLLRQLYRDEWVVRMVARSDFAPPPETYFNYIRDRFFGGSFAA